jgi:hypothetical protein
MRPSGNEHVTCKVNPGALRLASCQCNHGVQVRYEKTEAVTDTVHHPMDPQIFSVPVHKPTVHVVVDSMRAQCRSHSHCSYTANPETTPMLSAVSVLEGSPNVSITGVSLLGVAAAAGERGWLPAVQIGDVECAESTRSDTSITCILQTPLPVGDNPVKVSYIHSQAAAVSCCHDCVTHALCSCKSVAISPCEHASLQHRLTT